MIGRNALIVLVTLTALGCKGPTFGLGAGTQVCTPSRVVDGVVVDNGGAPFKWTMRRKATAARSVSMGWGEHRALKARHCKGQRSYSIEPVIKVCMNAAGHVTETSVEQASLAPEFDETMASAMKSNRYCPMPVDSLEATVCHLERLNLNARCD